MEYTSEILKEDTRIANYVFNKKFAYLSYMREDLIQECLIALYKARPNFDITRGKYITFASFICHNTIIGLTHLKSISNYKDEIGTLALDIPIGKDNDDTLLDTISSKEIKLNLDYNYLKSLVNRIFKTVKRPLHKQMIMLYFSKGESERAIAQALNCSYQYVSKVVNTFRRKLQAYLKADKFMGV